jgi:hypothetical protein
MLVLPCTRFLTAYWIVVAFCTLLTSLFCIEYCSLFLLFLFTTLYITIPHDKICYDRQLFSFRKKMVKSSTNFVIHDTDFTHMYLKVDNKEMLVFLIDNIFVVFDNQIFQWIVGIPMGTNCYPLLVDSSYFMAKCSFFGQILQFFSSDF